MSAPAGFRECPDWCVEPRDHGRFDVEHLGDDGRLHYSPQFGPFVSVIYDDKAGPTSWACEPVQVEYHGASPVELARELRDHVEDLQRAIVWLESR